MRKKGEIDNIQTLVFWAIIIGVGIILILLMINSNDAGREAFSKIKEALPFG